VAPRGPDVQVAMLLLYCGIVLLAVVILNVKDRLKAKRHPAKPQAHSPRLRPMFWVAILLLLAFGLSVATAGPPRSRLWRAFPVLAMTIIPAVLILARGRRAKFRDEPPEPEPEPSPKPEPAENTIQLPPWTWLVVIGLTGFIIVTARIPGATRWLLVLFIAAPVVLVATIVGVAWWRVYDAAVNRAMRRSRDGDLEGAIGELRDLIEDRGFTASRANALGLLLCEKSECAEAEILFRKVLAQRPKDLFVKANLGFTLWKQGRLEDAELVLREVASHENVHVVAHCNFCQLLLDLGRLDEAAEELTRAEHSLRTAILQRTAKERLDSQLRECRVRLEGLAGTKIDPADLDDLA
jgi:energy-coupling factor transporter transmembrane protein EcfT